MHGRAPEDALPQAAGARYFAMDAGEDGGEAPAAGRPASLLEVLPQEQVQRRTVEQIVDLVLEVPMLQMVMPQMVEQLVDLLSPLDFPVPDQVIEVPKIVCPPRAARTVLGAPQTVEQLVEAPTIVSLIDVIRQPVEQTVDIPVRARVGTGGRLQGVLPRQYCSSSVELIADIPVPHHGFYEGSQGFHPGQSTAASSEQIVDIPVSHGGPHLQDPRFASLPQEVAGEAFQGVFWHFSPAGKKCEDWSAPGVGTGCGLYFIHVVGSAGGFLHGRSWCVDAVSRWLEETSGLGSRSLAAWVMAGTMPSSCVSLRMVLEEFLVLCARAVRT